MPRPSSLSLSLTTCPAGRPRILVTLGLSAPFFMPSNAKVEVNDMLWDPNVACIQNNAEVREDEAGLYWTNQRAADFAFAAAQKQLPPAIWLWIQTSGPETPAEIMAIAIEVLGEDNVIRVEAVPKALVGIGFVAKLRIDGLTAEDAAARLDTMAIAAWDEEPREARGTTWGMEPAPILGWWKTREDAV